MNRLRNSDTDTKKCFSALKIMESFHNDKTDKLERCFIKKIPRHRRTKMSWFQLYKGYINVNYLEIMKRYRMRENRNRNVKLLVKEYKVQSDE